MVPERRGDAEKKGSHKEKGISKRRRGPTKKKVKILTRENTLEGGEDLGDQRAAWRKCQSGREREIIN